MKLTLALATGLLNQSAHQLHLRDTGMVVLPSHNNHSSSSGSSTSLEANVTTVGLEIPLSTSIAETPLSTAQPPDNNGALIGGIVGGIVALLLVGGLIAFIVARSQRRSKDEPNNDAASQTVSVHESMSNSGLRVDDDVASHHITPPQNYNALPSIEDVYVKQPRIEYEHGDLTSLTLNEK